jgi:ubiquitin carboxyl-terminal hydrolase L5
MHLSTETICTQDEWLDRIGGVIEERMAQYSAQEIRFNLMALVKDQRPVRAARIAALEAELAHGDNPSLSAEKNELSEAQERANALREKWRIDNIRRKHNYVPLIFNLFQVLAERDELKPLLERAAAATQVRGAPATLGGGAVA